MELCEMGPKKDIIGALKKELEKEGFVFGLSTHKAENAWFFNGGMDFPSDVQDTTLSLYGRRYKNENIQMILPVNGSPIPMN